MKENKNNVNNEIRYNTKLLKDRAIACERTSVAFILTALNVQKYFLIVVNWFLFWLTRYKWFTDVLGKISFIFFDANFVYLSKETEVALAPIWTDYLR